MSFTDWPKPQLGVSGTFAVVALDPVASLASYKDILVNHAAKALRPQKRVPIQPRGVTDPYVRCHCFHPVGRGLPFEEDWATIPICPATEHPENRAPVTPSGPLPIENAYVHTLHTFDGGVSRLYTDRPSNIVISKEDTKRLLRAQIDDYVRHQRMYLSEISDDSGEWESTPYCGPWGSDDLNYGPAPDRDVGDGSDGDSYGDSEEDSSNSQSSEEQLEPSVEPHYVMWMDIDEAESYADPATHQVEIDQLLSIADDWQERMKSIQSTRSERLRAWLESVTECDPIEEQVVGDNQHLDSYVGDESSDVPVDAQEVESSALHIEFEVATKHSNLEGSRASGSSSSSEQPGKGCLQVCVDSLRPCTRDIVLESSLCHILKPGCAVGAR